MHRSRDLDPDAWRVVPPAGLPAWLWWLCVVVLAFLALLVAAGAVQAQTAPDARPQVGFMQPGHSAQCAAEAGCVIMSAPDFARVLAAIRQQGQQQGLQQAAQTCRREGGA